MTDDKKVYIVLSGIGEVVKCFSDAPKAIQCSVKLEEERRADLQAKRKIPNLSAGNIEWIDYLLKNDKYYWKEFPLD